jgi:hypothetical protein
MSKEEPESCLGHIHEGNRLIPVAYYDQEDPQQIHQQGVAQKGVIADTGR